MRSCQWQLHLVVLLIENLIANRVGLEVPTTRRIKGIPEPAWMHDPLFKSLYQIRGKRESGGDGDDDGDGTTASCSALLLGVSPLAEATDIVSDVIVKKMCKALSSSERDVDTSKPLHSYGVDSLVAVELRTWFMKKVGANMAVFDIMGGHSLQELAELAAKRSSFVI